MRACLNDYAPDVVVHLAAVVGGIGANRENPGRFFYENAIMGIELMERARLAGVAQVRRRSAPSAPTPSSRRCPSTKTTSGTATPKRPTPPTAWPRRCSWSRLRPTASSTASTPSISYRSTSTAPATTSIPASSHVIPALIRKFVEAKERGDSRVIAWGTGSASREFLYVDDAAEGIALATKRYDGAEPVNLGAGREITIRDLTETIGRLCGFEGQVVWDASQPDGQPRRMLDTSRARELFGFQAQTDFEQGLRQTIDWFVHNRPGVLATAARGR